MKEQIDKNLTDEETTKLLIETLQHNGLPVPASITSTSLSLDDNQLTYLTSPMTSNAISVSNVNGLPQEGTWEHSIKLTLFNIQQSVSLMLMDLFGDKSVNTNHFGEKYVKADKIGQAAFNPEDTISDSAAGLFGIISSFPTSLGSGAYNLFKQVLPPAAEASGEVATTGISATNAALGLLTVGALASVAYTMNAFDSDSATSVANTVDTFKRKDLMNAATDSMSYVRERETFDNDYPYYDYQPYYEGYQDYNQEFDHRETGGDAERLHSIPAKVEFYEPEHNPWILLGGGHSTKHLYRKFSKRGQLENEQCFFIFCH